MKKEKLIKTYRIAIVILVLIFSAFPILPRVIESMVLILLTVLSLGYFFLEGKKEWSVSKTKIIFALSIFFWVYLSTLIYTSNISYGLNNIKIMLPMVLLPLIFLINKDLLLDKKNKDKYIFIYITSILVFLIYLNVFVYKMLIIKDLNIVEIRDLFEKSTKVHGTYFSLWIGFGIILLLFKIQENKTKKLFLTTASLIILFFIYWQSIISARMPFVVTILFLVLFLFKSNFKFLIFILILIGTTFFILPKNVVFTERFERIKSYDFSFPKGEYSKNWKNISTEQIRNGIYYCSYKKIKEAPFFGHGVGDADDKLQECYDCKFTDTNTYKLLKYNSHNQYLDFILVSGLIGILIIMVFQYKIIKIAVKNKNIIYLYFLFYFILNISFENVLNRQDGVVFFSFFNSLLFFQIHKKNEESLNT